MSCHLEQLEISKRQRPRRALRRVRNEIALYRTRGEHGRADPKKTASGRVVARGKYATNAVDGRCVLDLLEQMSSSPDVVVCDE